MDVGVRPGLNRDVQSWPTFRRNGVTEGTVPRTARGPPGAAAEAEPQAPIPQRHLHELTPYTKQ